MNYPDDVAVCPFDERALPAAPVRGLRARISALRDDPAQVQKFLPRHPVAEYFELLFRYFVALLVTAIVYFTVLLVGIGAASAVTTREPGAQPDDLIVPAMVFLGVLAGCLSTFFGIWALPRGTRAFGSLAFLFIEATYWCVTTFATLAPTGPRDGLSAFGLVIACPSMAGAIPVFIFFNWGRWPKFSLRRRPR